MKTTDLGYGWFANSYENGDKGEIPGGMTIRNPDKGQRINLPPDSVERLRGIFNAVDAERTVAALEAADNC
jgi:hypothetical protein